jgi:hypothetical protein
MKFVYRLICFIFYWDSEWYDFDTFLFSDKLCNLRAGKSVKKEGRLVVIEILYYGMKPMIVTDIDSWFFVGFVTMLNSLQHIVLDIAHYKEGSSQLKLSS